MIVQIKVGEIKYPSGEVVPQTVDGLEVAAGGGQKIQIPFSQMETIETDAEDPEDATTLYIGHQGQTYSIPVPQKGTTDWNDFMEIMYPE
jgi:hypothetical protein